MEHKNYTEVLIDGTIYTLGGAEEESYLRKVAAYLNEKIGRLRRRDGFGRLNADYQNLTIHLNIADDYFKEQERADNLAEQKAALEKDAYSLKHELITTQMKLEAMERELQDVKDLLGELQKAAVEGSRTRAAQPAETPESGKAAAVPESGTPESGKAAAAQETETPESGKAAAAQQTGKPGSRAAGADRHRKQDTEKAEEEKQKALQAAAAALAANHPQRH